MSRTILVPVHELLVPRVAIESATTGFPDAVLELVECTASGERATMEATIADGSGEDSSGVPPDASDSFVALAHETAKTHGIDLRTATATGSFGQATVAHAEATGANMIIVGVERGSAESDPEIRDNINHIKSASNVPYSIVRS